MSRTSSAVRRFRYTLPGLWVALVFAMLSFTPSLLPRPAVFQGLVTGVDAAIGYGLGVLGAFVWREFADRPARPPARRWWAVLAVAAGFGLLLASLLGLRWQRQAAVLVDIEPQAPWLVVLVAPVAAAVFVLAIAAARALRSCYRTLAAWLSRHMGGRAARALAGVSLATVAVFVMSGVAWESAIGALDRTFALADTETPDGVTRPQTALRSGSPPSLVGWESLGREGRVFVGRGLLADEISEISGVPALDPIRVYAGTESAADTEERARLAVQDLVRAGGFEREHLLVVTTTGTGWVEPSAVGSFEVLTGGDSASIAIQYSHLPSWLSFLVDQERARAAGRLLFDAVYDQWTRLPVAERPALYVFGESLGSFGGETAFSGEFDLRNRVAGALFVGPPNFNPLYRSFVDDRVPGTPEIEPVYRGGRTIRFSNRPRDEIVPADAEWSGPRILYLQHPSDPVTWWSPDLILERPDWLDEPRGADVSPEMRWLPFVTFWQVSADLALGFSTEPGHGHNFTGEHVDGWAEVLRSDWTTAQLDQLRDLVRADTMSQPLAEVAG